MTLIPPAATVTSIPVYPGPGPATSIQPFTYRDGLTYLQRLEGIVKYIDRVLVPWVQENYDELAEAFTEEVQKMIDYVNDAIGDLDGKSVEEAIDELVAYVDNVLAQVLADGVDLQDPVMAAIVADEDSLTTVQLVTSLNDQTTPIGNATHIEHFIAARYGVKGDNNPASAPANMTALNEVLTEASAVRGVVELPAGVIFIEGSLPLDGYQCSIIGQGVNNRANGVPSIRGTVIKAVNQNGPVLDFSGFLWPINMLGKVEIGNFAVEGDATADSTIEYGVGGATKQGIRIPRNGVDGDIYPTGINMHDIVISQTGGVGWYMKDVYLSDFYNITVSDPINAKANNVPYVFHVGTNGNRFYGLGLRSLSPSGDCGISGALKLIQSIGDDGSPQYSHHDSVYYGTWLENIHVPTNGTIISLLTDCVIISDPQFFDCYKENSATGTSFIRLETAPLAILGGNIIRGVIPGRGTNPLEVDNGVHVKQDRNLIEGVKGYRGNNVIIDANVVGTTVRLGGAYGDASNPAVTNNSGNTSNTIIDEFLGIHEYGARSGTIPTLKTLGADFQYKKAAPLTVSTNFGPNMVSGANSFRYILGASGITFGIPSNLIDKILYITLVQDATGSRTINWNSLYRFPNNTVPVLSTAPNKIDKFIFEYSGTQWECVSQQIGML